jgi:hypothetical protein
MVSTEMEEATAVVVVVVVAAAAAVTAVTALVAVVASVLESSHGENSKEHINSDIAKDTTVGG